MKKILLAFDGGHYSEGALEFARQLNEKAPVLLTAAFLPQLDFANLWSLSGGGTEDGLFVPLPENENARKINENIDRFESYCVKHNIEHRVHHSFFDFALPELKKESRYADLLIISSERFYEQAGINIPNDYLKEALHDLECPAIVVPEKFEFPVRTILAYDGSASSVYAIKQFAYLFPEMATNEAVLIYANEKLTESALPEESNIEELAARHFTDLTLVRLEADPKKYFASWLLENKNAILVSGAFGRSGVSRLFRKSFVTDAIRDHRLPVFIAHR